MATTNTTKKVTKVQRNNDIIAILRNEPVQFGTTVEDAIAHLLHENELLSRKNNKSGGTKKLTKDQEQNEKYKDDIRKFLSENPARLVSANELMVELFMIQYPEKNWPTQKITALLNAMSDKLDKEGNIVDDSGELEKFPAKGKTRTLYRIKPDFVLAEEAEEDVEE